MYTSSFIVSLNAVIYIYIFCGLNMLLVLGFSRNARNKYCPVEKLRKSDCDTKTTISESLKAILYLPFRVNLEINHQLLA